MNAQHPSDKSQLPALRQHLSRQPRDGAAWLNLAQLLAHQRPGPELHQAIDQATRLLPDNYQAWRLAGLLHQHRNGTAAALRWLDQIARQNPGIAAPQLAAADLAAAQSLEMATTRFSAMVEAFPQDDRPRILLADWLQQAGRTDAAAEQLAAALEINPDSPENWARLAECRIECGDYGGAVDAASELISRNAQSAHAHILRGDAYRLANGWKRALKDYRTAVELGYADARLLNNIGSCHAGLEDYAEARQHFQRALQLEPGMPETRLNIGLLYACEMQPEQAMEHIRSALQHPYLAEETRHSAESILALLAEQQRLQPVLQDAVNNGSVTQLHRALAQTPSALTQAHAATVQHIENVADALSRQTVDTASISHPLPAELSHFIEACYQCKIELEADSVAALYTRISADHGNGHSADELAVRRAMQTIQSRSAHSSELLYREEGEAWLRYWHACLMGDRPEKAPGHFKAAANAIGFRQLTPPERVAGTYRALFSQVKSRLPAGAKRGILLYIAANLIHGFSDGNGKLSRFLMAWECESQGLSAILIPPHLRSDATAAMDQAWYENDLDGLLTLFARSGGHTAALAEGLAGVVGTATIKPPVR